MSDKPRIPFCTVCGSPDGVDQKTGLCDGGVAGVECLRRALAKSREEARGLRGTIERLKAELQAVKS